jgi:hypothetical protein
MEYRKLTLNAGIASPRPLFLGAFLLSTPVVSHTFRSDPLSSAVDDYSAAQESLDQPMILTSAVIPPVHTLLAEVEITAIAIAAMEVTRI